MDQKISRREALKGLFYSGIGLAASGPLLQALGSNAYAAGVPAENPWKEAPEGSRIDARSWSKLGETLGMLGLGCMRLPTKGGGGGGFGRSQSLDQEAVNAMVDYAIAHGVNYFDTAPAYGESEVVVGKALSRHPRESYRIATKMSNMSGRATLEAGKQMFETSLKNLQVDYVDFLLLHNIQNMSGYNARFRDNGLFDWLLEQKAKGRIRHLGFSFHGSNADFPGLVDLYDWDFVQIQLNYADWKDMPANWGPSVGTTSSEYLYNYLVDKGIPVLVMEPVKGGALANVSEGIAAVMRERHPDLTPAANALTFVGSLPGVMVTLSGMSNMEQLKENVSLFTGFKPFDQKEMDFMLTVADLYKSKGQIPCTACRYCMPCPQGVDIPGNFRIFNTASDVLTMPDADRKSVSAKQRAFLKLYREQDKGIRADACISCNACLPKCPQHISIPQHLHRISEIVAKL
ncbi:MAG: aldo/keto reductase [Bacteroidales bacterium]|jgi:predicted aldo/keto reductase-like oxidoreductase|nr:aldo/keto reductase [Bacteroidales bacterium]